MRHNVVIDVSGRMEKGDRKDAALAFSNEIAAAVFVPGEVKLAVHEELCRRNLPRKSCGIIVFVAGVYLLLEFFLDQIGDIVIDDELPGWDKEIKSRLLDIIRRKHSDFSKSQVDIRRIGEGTEADKLAWLTRKKERKPTRKLMFSDFMATIQQRQK